MPDPVLVPPVPVVNQTDSPEQIAATVENVQAIFDKVSPKIRGTPTPEKVASQPSHPIPPVAPVTSETVTTPETKPTEAPEPRPEDKSEARVPSFIEKALKGEEVTAQAPAAAPAELVEEWPDELPQEQKQSRIKGLRDAYKALKEEVKTLRSRPPETGPDDTTMQKLSFLEDRNKEMETVLSRMGVEHHVEFQERILRPMHGAWNEAVRIVQEAGGDPNALSKALTLSGRPQYEALDEIFSGMPESAKIEANEAIRNYRRFDEQRRIALANAPRTAEALKKADIQRQLADVQRQKSEMKQLWDDAGRLLRDEGKLEAMQRSQDPDAKWWNEQGEAADKMGEQLFLENTDMKKVAIALRLAPYVDFYRKLWLVSRAKESKLNNIIKERFGSEPNLSESGGNVRNGISSSEEDLKRPFDQVFLREFHKQRERGVR